MAMRRETSRESMAGEARGQAEGMAERMKDRAKSAAESGMNRAASRMEHVGQRMERRGDRMEAEGGLKGQAGKMMHRAGNALEGGADYLRTHEVGKIREDAMNQIRSHPLLSVGLAVGTGFLLGRMTGGGAEEEDLERCERRLRMERRARLEADQGRRTQLRNALIGGVGSLLERRMRGR